MMKPIWIVDDDQSIRWVLEKALSREKIPHRSFSNPNDVLNALEKESPEVLISDIRMPRGNGLDLLQHVKASHPNLPVIIMTAYSDLESAVSSFQGGAFEYLTKPFDIDKAVELIHRAVGEGKRTQTPAKESAVWLQEAPEIIGQAPAMQEVFRAIGRLSQSQVRKTFHPDQLRSTAGNADRKRIIRLRARHLHGLQRQRQKGSHPRSRWRNALP
ncbi:MAG: hypothetical protein RLZ21_760 [Pseudomonadota bacterium]